MSKKFNIEYREVVQVSFTEPEKTEAFFITEDPTEWRKSFFTPYDIEDLAEGLVRIFKATPEYYDKENGGFTRFVEGFGDFNRQAGEDVYSNLLDTSSTGEILIEVTEEEDIEFITELS